MKYIRLIVSIFVCQLAGVVGSLFTASAIPTWYAILNKPTFSPPNWIFGPVWLTLYTLMGIALYLIWQKGLEKKNVRKAIVLFGIHLLFNAAWSIVFFGAKNIFAAFLTILILWSLIMMVIVQFYRLDKRTGYLLAPYILWVTFAACLNFSLWLLNP